MSQTIKFPSKELVENLEISLLSDFNKFNLLKIINDYGA